MRLTYSNRTMHRSTRSTLSILCGLAAATGVFVLPSFAQNYPLRPIRLIVPFPPGGTIDMVGRMVANPPYNAQRDFAPITTVATVPYLLLTRNGSALTSIKELLAAAKQKPGSLNYGSAGAGSTSHLAAAMFTSMAGINVVHVPYKGSAPAATDLFGGQIQFVFEAIGAGVQYAKTGRLRALGVSTPKRSMILPDLPTISEQGVTGYEMSTWHSVAAPRGTPPPIIDKLNREIVATLGAPEVRERFIAAGTEPQSSTPEQLRVRIAREIPRWDKLLTQLGLKK